MNKVVLKLIENFKFKIYFTEWNNNSFEMGYKEDEILTVQRRYGLCCRPKNGVKCKN